MTRFSYHREQIFGYNIDLETIMKQAKRNVGYTYK